MKKIIIITLFLAGSLSAQTLIDSYPESNYSVEFTHLRSTLPIAGQSFIGNGYTLTSAKFYIFKTGVVSGSVFAQIYAHTGTYGTSSKGTGDILVESEPVNVSTISGSLSLVTFTFSTPYTLQNGTYYITALSYSGTDGIYMGADNTSPSHAGNTSLNADATWYSYSGYDLIFYIYGTAPSATFVPIISID